MKRTIFFMYLPFFLIYSIACSQEFDEEPNVARTQSISMNRISNVFDGQWEGMTVASDGNAYFSASSHSTVHGAGFYRFNPINEEFTILSENITNITGGLELGIQQGKIHSPIVESDGWLYFATHISNYFPWAIEKYPGAHIIGYELDTGEFRDYGVVREGFSIYSFINIDKKRKKLYAFVVPFKESDIKSGGNHIYSIDIESGNKKDLGVVTEAEGNGSASFSSFIDYKGNLWFTLYKRHVRYEEDRGNLYCYSHEENRIITYNNVLPYGELFDGMSVTDQEKNNIRAWTWARSLPGNKKALFTMGPYGGGDERLWVFDPSENIESGDAFKPIASIGSTYLNVALGGDKLYFVQYEDLEDARTIHPQRERDKHLDSITRRQHLRSISLKNLDGDVESDGEIKDYGSIIDQDGRFLLSTSSVAADDRGHVYIYGSWSTKSPEESSMQVLYKEYPNGDIYKLMERGEFFGYFNANKN